MEKQEKKYFTGVTESVKGSRKITIPMDDITYKMEQAIIEDPSRPGTEKSFNRIVDIKKALNKFYIFMRDNKYTYKFDSIPDEIGREFYEQLKAKHSENYANKTLNNLKAVYNCLLTHH